MTRAVAQLAFVLMPLMLAVSGRAQTQETSGQNSSGAAPAATGLDTATQMSENPPLSGLDEPRFEPGFGSRSYLQPKAEVTEAIDSNAAGNFSRSSLTQTMRAFGSLDLEKLWKAHPLDVDYVGGMDYYSGTATHVYQVQSLTATQRFLWRTGQFALRDSFSYLPEGAFGFGSFGGAGGTQGLGNGVVPEGSGTGILTSGQFGSIGNKPRITNAGTVDMTQYLSPRSAVVLTGVYGLTNFVDNPSGPSCSANPNCFFNSQEVVGEAAYNYQISRRDQIAALYAYEGLRFPTSLAGTLNVNLWQLLYGHRISGKLYFLVGGGPELVNRSQNEEELVVAPGVDLPLGLPCTTRASGVTCAAIKSSMVTGSGRLTLRYHASARSELVVSYLRYISAGSGFFGGANTDAVRSSVKHALGLRWSTSLDGGYTRNSRLLAVGAGAAGGAADYRYWYVGASLHRQMSRSIGGFVSYQYNDFSFGNNGCTTAATRCGLSYGRNIGLIGLHWTPRPIRLD